jgi:hypothetical protein
MAGTLTAAIKHKRDTAANWTTNNPVLLEGQIGFEKNGSVYTQFKVGDGVTAWNSLAYFIISTNGTLSQVLTAGNNAGGLNITNVGNFDATGTVAAGSYKIGSQSILRANVGVGSWNIELGQGASGVDGGNGGYLAIGAFAYAETDSIAIGLTANAGLGSIDSIALGRNAVVDAGIVRGIAIGRNANSKHNNAWALGYNAVTTANDQIVLGASGVLTNIPSLTASTVVYLDASKNLTSSSVTPTELGYVSGATSNIQNQINALTTGLFWKAAVRAATTAAGTLASDFENGDTIDGVVLATGDRILIKNQASAVENGIYVVNASGAPTRATDFDNGADNLSGSTVAVQEGTANADLQYVCSTNNPITVGVSNINFVLVGGTTYVGTTNRITVTGNVIDIAATYAGQASITTLGTIATGTWQGTSISTTYTDAKIKGSVAATAGVIAYGTGTADTLSSSTSLVYTSNSIVLNNASSPNLFGLGGNRNSISLKAQASGYQAVVWMDSDTFSGIGFGNGSGTFRMALYHDVSNNRLAVYGASLTQVLTVNQSGSLYIGAAAAATARLEIAAGTTTLGPLKLTSGTNLTTAVAGTMEYNGTNLFFTRSGTTRESVICANAVNSVSPTSPNRTITVVIDGTTYYLHAKTTND